MSLLALFLDIRDKPCLVVGGGKIAARKLKMLCQAQARVTVIAPVLSQEVTGLCDRYTLSAHQRAFADSDIDGQILVIAATDDAGLNHHISRLAKQNNIFVNVSDDFRHGDAVLPSVIERGPIQIAVTTGGASPVLARILRRNLESCIPAAYGALAALAAQYRRACCEIITDETARRRFWEDVLQGPIAEMALAGKQQDAQQALQLKLAQKELACGPSGAVYLVGAGPGDPDLLTFRALRLMQQADVVVYDRLVSNQIMQLIRKDADKIYAGKQRSKHTLQQESINQLLVRLARQGKRVLRLKGGDPFIFGRGGEEIQSLAEQGIHFQIVPGITAATGCAAYAGIPLTHREHAQACTFVTGHLKDGSVNLNWQMLVHSQQTLVFYMGLHGLKIICQQLIKHGRKADTPAALVTKGTTPNQRVLIGDLSSLPDLVHDQHVHGPTLIIIGGVVNLHSKLHWYLTEKEITA